MGMLEGASAEVTALEEQVAYLIPYAEGKFSIGDKVFGVTTLLFTHQMLLWAG